MEQNNPNMNMNDIFKYHIIPYISDSRILIILSKLNRDLNKFIIRNSIIWENISMCELGISIKNMSGYRSHKEFYSEKTKELYLENYCQFYFNKIKESDDLKTRIVKTRINNFNNSNGQLSNKLVSDLVSQNYEFSLKKIQRYEKLIQNGITIDVINTINYQKFNFLRNSYKLYDKDTIIKALFICGVVVTAPVSIPVLLVLLYIALSSSSYGR